MIRGMYRLPAILFLFVVLAPAIGQAEPRDHRFGAGFSVWGLGDDFDKGTIKLTYEFGEIERFWDIRVVASVFSDDSGNYYISAGPLKEFSFNQNWSWGIGGEAGYFSGDVLGNEIEFYSRILLNYHLSEASFLRPEIGHISNAGFGDRNPGSENVAITYSWEF